MKSFRTFTLVMLAIGGFASDAAAQQQQQPQAPNTLLSFERRQGYVLLFDGMALDLWAPQGTAEWKVVDGTVTPTPGSGNGHLATKTKYGNFHFEVDFWMDPAASTSVYLRVPEGQLGTAENSYQIVLNDADATNPTGSIVGVSRATQKVPTVGEWHNLDVLAIGGIITIMIDETTVVDIDMEPRGSATGTIQLGSTARGKLQYRNIRILPL